MTFARGVFLFALAMLVTGAVGAHLILTALFGNSLATPNGGVTFAAISSTPAPHHTHAHSKRIAAATRHTHVPLKPTALPTARLLPTIPPLPTATILPPTATAPPAVPTAAPTLVLPTATPTTGIVTLARYWVGSPTAAPGQTVSIGYVIDNGTGQTLHLLLGATLKPSTSAGWGASINDEYHDVVATVPPGVSDHERFFTLPAHLHAGTYDVAWGLRDTVTGARDALVVAPTAITVGR